VSLTIRTYSRDLLEPLVAFTNAQTASEPHVAPLTPERFIALVEAKEAFEPDGLFVAFEGTRLVGWVHACVASGTEGWQDPTVPIPRIRMLLYDPSLLVAGRALVGEATRWLRSQSDAPIDAMGAKHGYPFYRGIWFGGEPMAPASLPHVHLAFEVSGYQSVQESVFMTATMESPPQSPTTEGVDFEETPAPMLHDGMRHSWEGFEPMRIRAFVEEVEAGSVGWVLLHEVAERLGAPVVNIWSLGVRESYRRRGIATALCAQAMALGYAKGARFASVATQLWNAPAHSTYARLGFRPSALLIGRERAMERGPV